jgi:ribose 5-phosphate isomerase RpiB
MTAGIPENTLKIKERTPRTRLRTALRSVSDSVGAGAAAAARAAVLVEAGLASLAAGKDAPHFGQEEAGSLIAEPQVEQYMSTSFKNGGEDRKIADQPQKIKQL